MASFLGNALVKRGLISEAQLNHALDIQRQTNPLLGELAIEQGLLDSQQVQDINIVQRLVDQRFGDIALEEKLLTQTQVEQLLEIQQQRRRRLGDILVNEGFIDQTALQTTLRSLKQQAESDYLLQELNTAQQCAIGAIEKLFGRVLQSHCKHTRLLDANACHQDQRMTLTIVAEDSPRQPFMRLSIACDRDTLFNIAANFMGMPASDCDNALAQDALGEILNMSAGYIISDPTTEVKNLEPTPAVESKTLDELYFDNANDLVAIAFESQIGAGCTFIALA